MAHFPVNPPPDAAHYVLGNAHIPPALCDLTPGRDGWCLGDIEVQQGQIKAVTQAGTLPFGEVPVVDAGQGILLSALVDCHTHIDKAHVAAFADFPPGDLAQAIAAMAENLAIWTPENLGRRANFSLQSAYANGARALRSHVGIGPTMPDFVWPVMQELVQEWRGRIDLQLSPLTDVLSFDDADLARSIYATSADQGRVGMFLYHQPDMAIRLRRVMAYADAQGWDIDLHVDEGLDPDLDGLHTVANVALEVGFKGKILCGHCVALNSYAAPRRNTVIARALEAGLHFVALPTTNLYLQGRSDTGIIGPRGMAPVALLAEAGATVSMGADNVRDGFCAFGDFDPLSVLHLGAQLGHLHDPARAWSQMITTNPARSMGLDWDGRVTPGAPADLVLMAARCSTEMSLSAAPERQVIRAGKWLNIAPPGIRDLT
jgi:cytosine deaminase